MSSLFDSHCHPQFAAYDADREEIIQRAFASDVSMVAVGTSFETSKDAVELAKKHSGKVWATVGVHPHHATESPHDANEAQAEIKVERLSQSSELNDLARQPEVVGIGESGLDFYYLKDETDIEVIKATQKQNFIEHIQLAREVSKPLVVHARKAYTEVFAILKECGEGLNGVMHFFQGTPEEAKNFLDLGYYISFAGPITFAEEYRKLVEYIPLDRILAETDAPYATPLPHRGKKNEPAYVTFVIKKIAEVKELSFVQVAETTTKNARKLFGIN